MVHEFGAFRLDEGKRELRHGGREIALQPRVFDLLVYLVTHRDRVVGKNELLDAVWSDAVVSDGSLKRAVSLARSALRVGGLEGAIRTYARQGYRFDIPEVVALPTPELTGLAPERAEARAAHDRGRWAEATRRFAAADAAEPLEAADLERWAASAQLAGLVPEAIRPLERAVAAHGAASDPRGVARAALSLAMIHFERMDLHVARGWLSRARSVLPAMPTSREHGLLASLASRFAVAEGALDEAVAEAERGLAIGRELDDIDIELFAMSYLGIALVARGEVERGLALHDEAAAVVLSGCATPLVGGLVYCGLIWTCRNRGDWQRAAEWTGSFTRWCGEQAVHHYSGNCRLHHAEVLHYQGALDQAESEATEACRALAELAPYAEGDAFRVLGDLRLAQGDLAAADEAFRRAHELGWDPQPGFALLQVARGRADAGLRALERSLEDTRWANRQRRGLLLAHGVMVALEAGVPERARELLLELEAHPELWATTALDATVREARAELRAYEGDRSAAVSELRQAILRWHRVGSPMHVARHRLRLAELHLEDGDLVAAELELSTARSCLDKLSAPALLERAANVGARLASLGGK